MQSKQVKTITKSLATTISPLLKCIDEDVKKSHTLLLEVYFSKYGLLIPNTRISNITIVDNTFHPYILIEIKDKNGNISTLKKNYNENIKKAVQKKRKQNNFSFR